MSKHHPHIVDVAFIDPVAGLDCAMLQEANWSKSNSYWDMYLYGRPNDISAASNEFSWR